MNVWQAWRQPRRWIRTSPMWAASLVINLGLAAGVTVAAYSILDAILLRPFPFKDPSSLALAWASPTADVRRGLAWRDFQNLGRSVVGVEESAAFLPQGPMRVGEGREIVGAYVEPAVFQILGVSPAIGRPLSGGDVAEDTAVISARLRREIFSDASEILGRSVSIDGRSRAIVGVMPESFFFPDFGVDVWLPLSLASVTAQPSVPTLFALVRLAPSATPASIKAQLDRLPVDVGQQQAQFGVYRLADLVLRNYRAAVALLVVAVVVIWLIAIANATVLLLAKGTERQKELAVRYALGASRRHLIAQLVAELVPLLAVSLVLSMTFAAGTLQGIQWLSLTSIPRLSLAALDWPAMLVALALVVAGGALSGWWAATVSTRTPAGPSLQLATDVGQGSPTQRRIQNVFVVAQLATATSLCILAVLLLKAFGNVAQTDWGVGREGTALIHTQFEIAINRNLQAHIETVEKGLQTLKALPDVMSVGMGYSVPGKWGNWSPRIFRAPGNQDQRVVGGVYQVSTGYFSSLHIPVLRGREFAAGDSTQATPVVVVSRALSLAVFGTANPIGRHLEILEGVGRGTELQVVGSGAWEVVGEVADVRMFGLDVATRPALYVDYRQERSPVPAAISQPRFVIRTAESASMEQVLGQAKERLQDLNSGIHVVETAPMEQILGRSLAGLATTKLLGATFAGLGGLSAALAAIGFYGLMVQLVSRSRYELALRAALGADGFQLGWTIIGRALRLCCLALLIGAGLAYAGTRSLGAMLTATSPLDPIVYLGVGMLALLVVCGATLFPAFRASRISPNLIRRL